MFGDGEAFRDVDVPRVFQPRVTPALLWRTVRHLRPEQIKGQIVQRLRRRIEVPGWVVPAEWGRCPGLRWAGLLDVPPPGGERQPTEALLAGRFTFLNQTLELGFPPDWEAGGASHLWRYHLHYCDWFWDLPFEEARKVLLDWMQRHPLEAGRVGWEPYPVSLRLQSWLPLFLGRHREKVTCDDDLLRSLWRSVARQVRWLLRRLERHIAANHLLENAIAVTLAGCCFDGEEAQAWQRAGGILLEQQLAEQFTADGLHYERSPMYHVRLVYALLVLASSDPDDWRQWLAPTIGRALEALLEVTHPDGEIALLNDSAFGVQPSPRTLLELAEHLGVEAARAERTRTAGAGSVSSPAARTEQGGEALGERAGSAAALGAPRVISLPEAGYHGARTEDGEMLIVDAGAIGPDHQPGHGHADMLSFELSAAGRRLVTDTGVGSYQEPRWRAYARSTAAHSTVEIGGESQVELWGRFRVGRRSAPREVEAAHGDDGSFRLVARHDGYARLPGAPMHRRRFTFVPAVSAASGDGHGSLTVEDEVPVDEDGRGVPAVARVVFAPDLEVQAEPGARPARSDGGSGAHGGGEWRISVAADEAATPIAYAAWTCDVPSDARVAVERVPVFPQFGVVRAAPALVLRASLPLRATLCLWWPRHAG